MWLHAMVCTSRVDASIAAEILAIGRRVRKKMAGAMLLASAVLGVGKVFCSVTYSLVKELAIICRVCAANLEFSSLQLPEFGIETQNAKHNMHIASYCNTRTTK